MYSVANSKRYFTRNYIDFMDCDWLPGEEKVIYMILKRFLDVNSNSGKVSPTIATIQKMTMWGKQKVIKYINRLVGRGLVKKIKQGPNRPNAYIVSDAPGTWDCDNIEEMETSEDNKGGRPLTTEEHVAELERRGYEVTIKKKEVKEEEVKEEEVIKKEPVSGGRQTTDTSAQLSDINIDNHITDESESQECYSISKDESKSQESDSMPKAETKADANALLDRLWVLYPVKKGKGRISVTQKKKLLKIGYDEMARAIERYKQYVESVDYLHYQYGSTFFNGGYVDYLDANYDPESERKARNNQAKSGRTKNKFNDYPSRDYDFDAIKRGMFDQ